MNKPQTIDEYLALVDPTRREVLNQIRTLVKQLVPSAEETISYNMPTLKYKNRPLVYFTASKNHMSFYPSSWAMEDFKEQLQDYKQTQHAIQFTLEKPLSEKLITELVLAHKQYIDAGRKA
ncbi:DUF1801 domain-containing protein [Enterococcus saccharolyticus]|uniref:YdhG-like domain-containing protein n=1 Tax=Candidatus Enterococcus willemsii TaxID=1857215 RepID=A0ABQ6YWT6_9ENTE|nr:MULTISPECIES: DUF1801 domain-containing protein [Enterococcus]KAF1301948.1 hypothetical protein BAU17_00845 [Enterococcus sp. CU12B]MCD5002945.1 DUF1801 domain-containing protein [Enterococcus saccharolyticus]